MIGENLDDTPTWGGDKMDYLTTFIPSMPFDVLYDRDAENNDWEKSQLIDLINSNEYFWINHLGHSGNTYGLKMGNADIASLTNSEFIFVYTQGCYSGAFDNRNSGMNYISSDSISEELTVGFNDRGAFGVISNARYGWYCYGSSTNCASNILHKNFLKAIYENGYSRIGEAHQYAKGYLGGLKWDRFDSTLFGDPVSPIINITPPCNAISATNEEHETAGRAHSETTTSGWWWGTSTTTWYANGSNENMGTSGSTTTSLTQTQTNYYTIGSCPEIVEVAPTVSIDNLDVFAYNATISGTGTDDNGDYFRVEVKIDDNEWQAVNNNKEWTVTIDGFNPDETHTVSARAYDSGGQFSNIAGPVSFTTRGSAPVISNAYAAVRAASINVSANVTDVDGDLVKCEVKIGNSNWVLTTNECTGNYTHIYYDDNGFTEGDYDIYVRAFDAEGRNSEELFVGTVTVEEQHPPQISSSIITREWYDGMYILKSYISDEDNDLMSCEFKLDNGEWSRCDIGWFGEAYARLGTFETLELGGHTAILRIGDTAENIAYSEILTFEVVELVAPEITSLNVLINADLSSSVIGRAKDIDGDLQRIEINIDNAAEWTVVIDWGEEFIYGDRYWDINIDPLTKGIHNIQARAIDKAGKISPIYGPLEFTVNDAVAPTCTINDVTKNETEGYYEVTGIINDANNNLREVALKLDNEDYWNNGFYYEAGNNGEIVYAAKFWPANGQRQLSVKAIDTSDLESNCGTISFVVGSIPTVDTISTTVNSTSVTINGTASDDDNNIDRIEIQIDGGSWIAAQGTNTWNITLNDQLSGDHIVNARAIDSDNLTSETVSTTYSIDAPAFQCFTATNNEHESNNRAHSETVSSGYWWSQTTTTTWYANGSNDNLGTTASTIITLVEQLNNPGHFTAGDCPTPAAAPVITNLTYSVNGQNMTINVDVTDINDDLNIVRVEYVNGEIYATCSASSGSQFSCTVTNHQVGTFNFVVAAYDDSGLSSKTAAFEATFIELAQNAPVIESHTHAVSGTTITVSGVASDADGDLQAVVITGLASPFTCQTLNTNTGDFSCTITGLTPGDYTISIVATDSFANESTPAGPIAFTIEDINNQCFTAVNSDHVSANRAVLKYGILVYAAGSDDYLGLDSATTTLEETSPGYWSKVDSCQ